MDCNLRKDCCINHNARTSPTEADLLGTSSICANTASAEELTESSVVDNDYKITITKSHCDIISSASEDPFENSSRIQGLNQPLGQIEGNCASTILKEDHTVFDLTSKLANLSTAKDTSADSVYHIKWINFHETRRPTITQNKNGPCPMIAIANLLLLRGNIDLPAQCELISGERILSILTDHLLLRAPENLEEEQMLNLESNILDALRLIPEMEKGLDINVRFTGITDFEYTSTLNLFDMFNIPIYHGWLVDPDDEDLRIALGNQSYNQILELKFSDDPLDLVKGLLIDEFLQLSASQLTFYGLSALLTSMRNGQLAVLFRNNHFSTILKHQDRIYVLVTDMGFLNETSIVWEVLNDLDGDTQFVDSLFKLYNPSTTLTQSPQLSPCDKVIPIRKRGMFRSSSADTRPSNSQIERDSSDISSNAPI